MTKKTPYKQMTDDQKTLLLYLKRVLTQGAWFEFSPSDIGGSLEMHPMTVGKSAKRLGEIGYISVRGKGDYREIKLNKKGVSYGAHREKTKVVKIAPKIELHDLEEGIDDSRPLSPAEEELMKIRELVRPRPWETTYEAVQSMMDWIRRKRITEKMSRR